MKRVGDYEVIGTIGQGGMAVVYKGLQASLKRPVAIKVLSQTMMEDPEIVERFNRESLIIAQLSHPNIIHVIDRGITEGMPYFVMEFVEGTTLARVIKEGLYDNGQKLDVVIQVCKALSYAHKNGVVHRDIKPANILIDKEGNAQVSDFGIAHIFNEESGGDPLTAQGLVIGTPAYMSPEQKEGSIHVTATSDLYSLGAVMYELFTGSRPHGYFRPPSEVASGLPQGLDRVILKCLAAAPADRFQSADELKDLLLELIQGAHLKDTQKERAFQGIQKIEDKFSLLDVIKDTQYTSVYLFQDKVDKQLMAIKKCKRRSGGVHEAKLLNRLRHENIVDIYGVSENEKSFIIVMEYANGGSLKDQLIRSHPWQDVLVTAKGLCEGLVFAHRNRIIHGNLRPSNVLFSKSGEVKLCDFGLDEHYTSGNWYAVPHEPKTPQTDIFAAGVIIYEMLAGMLPVWRGGQFSPSPEFKSLPFDLQEMVSKMLCRDQERRYRNLDEVLLVINDLLQSVRGAKTLSERSRHRPRAKAKQVNRDSRALVLFTIFLVATGFYALFHFESEIRDYLDDFGGKKNSITKAIEKLW